MKTLRLRKAKLMSGVINKTDTAITAAIAVSLMVTSSCFPSPASST